MLVFFNLVFVNKNLNIDYVLKVVFFMFNEIELVMLIGLLINNLDEIKVVVCDLISCGVENLIIMLGYKGVFWVIENYVEIVLGMKVKVVDMIGVGDLFIGSFVYYFV